MNEEYFKRLKPLKPIPTGVEYSCQLSSEELSKINTIVFDVYGTLLISDSGDIGGLKNDFNSVVEAFEEGGVSFVEEKLEVAKEARALLKELILQVHEYKKKQGTPFPEIDIVKVWSRVLRRLYESKKINSPQSVNVEKLAVKFEFLNNPTYPMPEMDSVLKKLKSSGYELGIVSNAQFFTPLLLKYFLEEPDFLSEAPVSLFKPAYCIYSYKEGFAKPGIELYAILAKQLQEEGIKAEQVLFVGNDMLNDVYAASQVGFKTALFAGDKRSLRMRETHNETKGLEPDAIITELKQIEKLFTGLKKPS